MASISSPRKPALTDFGDEAFSLLPKEILDSAITLFPAFWSIFFAFKDEGWIRHHGIEDSTAYTYAKEVLMGKREPPEGIENLDIDIARDAYYDMLYFFRENLTKIIWNNAVAEKIEWTAKSQIHSILVETYRQYRNFEDERDIQQRNRWRRHKQPLIRKISIGTSREVLDLIQAGIIERYDARHVIVATYRKIEKIFAGRR